MVNTAEFNNMGKNSNIKPLVLRMSNTEYRIIM